MAGTHDFGRVSVCAVCAREMNYAIIHNMARLDVHAQ